MSAPHPAILNQLARQRGLGEAYYDHRGELKYFSNEARAAILQAMGCNLDDENSLREALEKEGQSAPTPILGNGSQRDSTSCIPAALSRETGEGVKECYQPPFLNAQKCWGLNIQLYTLRSPRNWGMGDFADLRELIELSAPRNGNVGCDVIGVNPLHALFPADPLHCSPYSPSSRLFLNILYIAVDAIPEFARCAPVQALYAQTSFQAALVALRATNDVMYEQVAALKLTVLRLLHEDFREAHLANNSARAQAFHEYVAQRGASLHLHALFDVLDEHFRRQAPAMNGWQQWPEAYRDPSSQAVQDFAAEHEYQIDFFLYAQWLADTQLASVQQLARAAGMRIGLYGDLAVGANPGGSEVWANQSLYVQGASVGAPPDPLALNGQDWGIPPIDPHALRAQGFAPFIELLRANMQHVGALRIDHVMSLFRLWWVPQSFTSIDGVYVHYPLDELVACLVRESMQAQCLVIGEDLGTVPDEVRHAMEQHRLFRYKVLLFEKHGDGRFKFPAEFPRDAVATASTHDLPPLKAWWQGDDLALRDRLALYPSADTAQRLHGERTADRYALMSALSTVGLWQWQSHEPLPNYSLALSRAVQLYLGQSQSALVLVQLEDLIGMTDPVNVPGTHTEHANWQRKLTMTTQDIFASTEVREMLTAMSTARVQSR